MEDQARWVKGSGLTATPKVPNYLNAAYTDALDKIKPSAVTIIR